MSAHVLVTGGAGYVGSHVVLALLDAGHRVTVIDDLSTGIRDLVPEGARFVEGDAGHEASLRALVRGRSIDAVMHFAASSLVHESMADPLKYYRNNVEGSRALVETCLQEGIDRLVFSSSAAVYGQPEAGALGEDAPCAPINPYGATKLATEWMLRDLAAVSELRYAALRYFNVAGADPAGRSGESTPLASHLIKIACQTALGLRPCIEVYGTDYPTPDGTCVRDYVHVTDIASAHVAALDHLLAGAASEVLNCGYGRGFSVREVLDAVDEVAGTPLERREMARRPGDPPVLIADCARLWERFGWRPAHDDLHEIVGSALAWERQWAARTRAPDLSERAQNRY